MSPRLLVMIVVLDFPPSPPIVRLILPPIDQPFEVMKWGYHIALVRAFDLSVLPAIDRCKNNASPFYVSSEIVSFLEENKEGTPLDQEHQLTS